MVTSPSAYTSDPAASQGAWRPATPSHAAPSGIQGETVCIWRCRPPPLKGIVERLAGSLCPEERQRADRFVVERARVAYVVSRGLLRMLLSAYLDVAPESLRLVTGRWGKPRLERAAGVLHFNLAHSGDLVLIAVGASDVGVDVERHRPLREAPAIARRFYDAEEAAHVERDAQGGQGAFFRLWTRKEAVVKTLGLALPSYSREAVVLPLEARCGWATLHPDGHQARVAWADLPMDPGYSAAVGSLHQARHVLYDLGSLETLG
jgi:4'-phosphopantetheinyl transferase